MDLCRGHAHLEVPSAEEASQKAHAEVADEDLLDREDDDFDAVLLQQDQRSTRKSTHVRALQAGNANEDEPEASHALKPKKAKTKAAADPKHTTQTQHQGVKRTPSFCYGSEQHQRSERASRSRNRTAVCQYIRSIECQFRE